MKTWFQHNFLLGLMLVTAFVSLVSSPASAAGNSVSLTPASGTSQTGNTFTVSVDGYASFSRVLILWVYGAKSVNGSLQFPAQNLKVLSINMAGSSFPNGTVTPNNTTGTITFNQSSSGEYVNQNVHLFSITFQSLAPNNVAVSFGSTAYNIGTAATTGGNYTISPAPTPPPPPPPPTPTPKPTPQSTPKPTPKPISAPVITAPPVSIAPSVEEVPDPVIQTDGGLRIENVIVTANRLENTVTWTVNNTTSNSIVTYGTSRGNLKSTGTVIKQIDGSYKTILKDLKLGTLYYFNIKATTPDNLQGANHSGVLTTKGYPVQLTIKQNDLLQARAKVKIGERSFVASKDAIISTELGDGTHSAIITQAGSNSSTTVTFVVQKKSISKNNSPDIQNITLNIGTEQIVASADNSSNSTLIISGVVGIIGITGLIGFILFKRRQQQLQETALQADSDLLAENYGDAISAAGNNRPEPNLDSMNNTSPSVLNDQNMPQITQFSEQPLDLVPPPTVAEVSDYTSSNMPLPYDTVLPKTAEPNITDINTTYSENEQLANEVTQVESTEQETAYITEEPSAVYDEATGVLDIIHHSSEHHTPSTSYSANPVTDNDSIAQQPPEDGVDSKPLPLVTVP
ncbi:MAG: hypothetical protein WAW80_02025 [Candidatus Saccharimonadales bacterium]